MGFALQFLGGTSWQKLLVFSLMVWLSFRLGIAHVGKQTANLLSKQNIAPRRLDWTDLMPAEELIILESMHTVEHYALSQQKMPRINPSEKIPYGQWHNRSVEKLGGTDSTLSNCALNLTLQN